MQKKLGFESIQFQNKNFGKELEMYITAFRAKTYTASKAQASSEKKQLESFILDRLGLKINLKLDTNVLAAIELPLLEHNHIFFGDLVKQFISAESPEIWKKVKDQEKKAFVDLENARIGGLYSSIPCKVYLSWNDLMLDKRTSDSEVTAIFLHELGHGFTTFEYMTHFVRTNQALASIANDLINKVEKSKYQQTIKDVGILLFNDADKFKDIVDIKDKDTAITYVLSKTIKETKSELGTSFYDETTCEYLADQFTTRQGYGKDLVSGLDKIYVRMKAPEKSTFMKIIFSIVSLLIAAYLIVGLPFILLGTGNLIIKVLLGLIFSYGIYNANLFTDNDFTYDILRVRYKRVKEQLIQSLKHDGFDNSDLKNILEEIAIVDKIINNTSEYETPIAKFIGFLVPSQKAAKLTIQKQRDLEELASNDLFVKSAQLRTI